MSNKRYGIKDEQDVGGRIEIVNMLVGTDDDPGAVTRIYYIFNFFSFKKQQDI